MSSADGWTLAMACAEFERAGMPVDPGRFGMAVTRVARIPRIGEMPSGEHGGRGYALYEIGELQELHRLLAKYLCPQDPPSGDT